MREMRRGERLLPFEETEKCLIGENWGVLSVHGDEGFPYGVPMNYVWDNGTVLMHCTGKSSHRLDSLRRDNRVCFTVVPEHTLDRPHWTTLYTSVIIFGTAEIIEDGGEKLAAMRAFMRGLAPEMTEEAISSCDPKSPSLVMLRVRPVRITGKRSD